MAWIGVMDQSEGRFCPSGLGKDWRATPLVEMDELAMMPRGTLMLETRMSPSGRPQVLFGFERLHPKARSLSVQAIPGGGVALVQSSGAEISHVVLRWNGSARTDVVRLTYAWDVVSGWARFALERPEEATVQSVDVPLPMALSAGDLREVLLAKGACEVSKDVVFAALSTEIEPIGPTPALALSTPVATPWGARALHTLRRGDLVTTQNSGAVPVLHLIERTVPALGSFRPIRLRAPYFGLQSDVIAAPDQRLIMRGTEVEYNFGIEAVLVPARHLLNGHAAQYEPSGSLVTYRQVLLPAHEEILAAGSPVESLYIGRLRRKADDLAASLLAGLDRSRLPEHGKPVHPVLRAFEAVTLVTQRAA